jgi:hypothetical protein
LAFAFRLSIYKLQDMDARVDFRIKSEDAHDGKGEAHHQATHPAQRSCRASNGGVPRGSIAISTASRAFDIKPLVAGSHRNGLGAPPAPKSAQA